MAQDLTGDTADYQLAQAGMTIRAHDQQIKVLVLQKSEQTLTDIVLIVDQCFSAGRHTVPLKMSTEFGCSAQL